ncbi:putative membrane protein YuiD [Weizmannia acidilactici]|uniref:divergent PAP2 family protein n=1 Tax=Weizmannia acidilactici TaxID=2607726 RepID=UPI00124C1FB0|nr:divergent PAP2 family protein [Weizmannia acidilactici]GER67518.1 putative membrane protein YuiD [Weizmannia acidilactici]
MFLPYPILAAVLGMLAAQIIKVPIHLVTSGEFNWRLAFSTGGMPSSHTSMVIALTTAIGLTSGFYSNAFAISLIFSSIVIYDATGVRRQAGYHAEVLNQLIADFNRLLETLKNPDMKNAESRKQLKELLGHKPAEVFFGIITGIVVGIVTFIFYPF